MSEAHAHREKHIFTKRLKDARIGDPEAQYDVGLMYANGVGVDKSLKHALTWTAAAAEKGHVAAQYLLGSAYAAGLGTSRNARLALRWFTKAAEQGHDKAALKLAKTLEFGQADAALEWCVLAAQAGLAEAQWTLGGYCVQGKLMPQDEALARSWYQKAADQDHAHALCALGEMWQLGRGGPSDMDVARSLYRAASRKGVPAAQIALEHMDSAEGSSARRRRNGGKRPAGRERRAADARWVHFAERGDANDCFCLGQMYEEGLGLEPNAKQAKQWYQKAAEHGHVQAQLAMGRLSATSTPSQAVQWYVQAAAQGSAEAQYALGQMRAEGMGTGVDPLRTLCNFAAAVGQAHAPAHWAMATLLKGQVDDVVLQCIERAANDGVVAAQWDMGMRYAHGNGVDRDLRRACEWWLQAAEQGNADAQCELGSAYAQGKGVAKDQVRAFLWFERAAAQGHSRAQWCLGELYAVGIPGVAADTKQATSLCKKAANANFAPAQATLAILFAKAKKHERAVHWWTKAAAQGDAESQHNLANAYHAGLGVKQDVIRAWELWLEAASTGLVPSVAQLGLCYAMGDGVALDQIEAAKWFIAAAEMGDQAAKANRDRAKSVMAPASYAESERRAAVWLQSFRKKR